MRNTIAVLLLLASCTTARSLTAVATQCTYDIAELERGWYAETPTAMPSLQCPSGYRAATASEAPLLAAVIDFYFVTGVWPGLSGSRRFSCAAGIASKSPSALTGCLQIQPKDVGPTVIAQAKVTYTCNGSAAQTRTVALHAAASSYAEKCDS